MNFSDPRTLVLHASQLDASLSSLVQRSPRLGSSGFASPAPSPQFYDDEDYSKEGKETSVFELDDGGGDQPELRLSTVKAWSLVVGTQCASTMLLVTNKAVLGAVETPCALLAAQLLVGLGLLKVSTALGYVTDLPPLSLPAVEAVAPLVACNVLRLISNSVTLQYVDFSYYQIARGMTLPLVAAAAALSSTAAPTRSIWRSLAMLAILAGFALGVSSELVNHRAAGTIVGVLSSLATAAYPFFAARSLDALDGDAVGLVYYTTLLSAVVVAPLVLFTGELPVLSDLVASGMVAVEIQGIGSAAAQSETMLEIWTFALGSVVSGVFSFILSIVSLLNLKGTSPQAHIVSTTSRDGLQLWIGARLFGETVGSLRIVSSVALLVGSALYTYLSARAPPPALPTILPSPLLHTTITTFHSPPKAPHKVTPPMAPLPDYVRVVTPRPPRLYDSRRPTLVDVFEENEEDEEDEGTFGKW